jgi:hypothetical protein
MPRRTLFLLPALLLFSAAGVARAQSSGPCDLGPPSDPAYYADMKELPRGKWNLGSLFDKAQLDAPSTPVALRGLSQISSAKQRAVKLGCAELENRSSRTVKSVTLRWAVTARAADVGNVEDGPALAKGTLPVIAVEIPPGVRQKAEIHGGHFADFLQSLAVAGEVNGQYNLTVGIARVEYTDGTAEDLP